MEKLILAYWDIRGLAEPARLMLEYGGVEYKDKRYKCGEEPPHDRSDWLDVKFALGLDFPNLPYLVDGDVKLTESVAIYRYIARKIGIFPTAPEEEIEVDMLEGVVNSFRFNFTRSCYRPDFEEKKSTMRESQEQKLQQFETFLHGRKFLLGDKISHVDFSFFETLDHHRTLFPDIFEKLPNIRGFIDIFESLEKIAAYRKSDRFKRFPINNPNSKWTGKFE